MNIRELRKNKGLTQRQLAVLCDVSLVTVQNWESGVSLPNKENMKKLEEIFNAYKT